MNPDTPPSAIRDPQSLGAVVFDLDGVIVDSEPLHEEAKRIVFAHYGLAVPASLYDAFKGRTDLEVMEHVASAYAGGRFGAAELVDAKHRAFRDLLPGLQLVPGVLAFVEALRRRGLPLAVATSAVPHVQRLAFDRFDLYPFFDAVVTAADITRPKPDPEPYEVAARKLGVSPSACLVVEDSVHGVTSGRRAGCRVAGLTTSFPSEALLDAGAHLTVDTYAELAQRLFGQVTGSQVAG